MKTKILFSLLLIIFGSFSETSNSDTAIIWKSEPYYTPVNIIENAFRNQISKLQVLQYGIIISILKDDSKGVKHQRFIVKLENGRTLLVAHNIDIAKRIPNPKINSKISFYGEYAWNNKGGSIHWTHRDPNGRHVDGWLEYEGIKYQ
jgi:hypothetical protein